MFSGVMTSPGGVQAPLPPASGVGPTGYVPPASSTQTFACSTSAALPIVDLLAAGAVAAATPFFVLLSGLDVEGTRESNSRERMLVASLVGSGGVVVYGASAWYGYSRMERCYESRAAKPPTRATARAEPIPAGTLRLPGTSGRPLGARPGA